MNRNTRKRKKEKKNAKTIKKKYKNRTKKRGKIVKKIGKIVKKRKKQSGGMAFLFPNTCSKKQIEKKYKVVFVKNQIGGENNEKKLEITPESCKMKIKDLEAQYNKYINEWKKL